MSKYIPTVWEYSLETEALRLIHCAKQITSGFYKINNFILLPYGKEYKNSSIVTFPDLNYSQIPRFWQRVDKVDVRNFPITADKALLDDVKNLLQNYRLPLPGVQKTKEIWSRAKKGIVTEIEKIIPSKKGLIKKIIIFPTVFGTGVSFNLADKFPAEIFIYLREDQNIFALVEGILTSITRKSVYSKLGGMWRESELLVDWLLIYSSISKSLKKIISNITYTPTVKSVSIKQKVKLKDESEKFYRKMGVLVSSHSLVIKQGKAFISDRPIEKLSLREKEILLQLNNKKGQVVTLDDLADIIFKDDSEIFSLQAIAKVIQRLRDKLEFNGISGSYIQTKRKEGYFLAY